MFCSKGDSVINWVEFRNILHNFGFQKLTDQLVDDELKKMVPPIDMDRPDTKTFTYEDVKWVVTNRYSSYTKDEESKECYALFDKKEKGYVDKHSLKSTFAHYLVFPVSDLEIDEFIKFADSNKKLN